MGIDLNPDDKSTSGLPAVAQEKLRKKPGSMADADFSSIVALIESIKNGEIAHEEHAEAEVGNAFSSVWRVLGIAGIIAVASSVSGGFATYYGVKSDLQDLHAGVKTNSDAIRDIKDDNAKVRQKYLPMIESADKVNDIQNDRFTQLANSVQQLRDSVEIQRKEGAAIHEDLAVMRNILQLKLGLPPR